MMDIDNLLNDLEEYFSNNNVQTHGKYDRLHPSGLLIRSYEALGELTNELLEIRRRNPGTDNSFSSCSCWRSLDDNDDI